MGEGKSKLNEIMGPAQIIQFKYITEIQNVIANFTIGLCFFNNIIFGNQRILIFLLASLSSEALHSSSFELI